MPRKSRWNQRGRRGNQWPWPSVRGSRKAVNGWEEHPSVMVALERWFARRQCDGTCNGHCERLARVSRLRTMYGRRRR